MPTLLWWWVDQTVEAWFTATAVSLGMAGGMTPCELMELIG